MWAAPSLRGVTLASVLLAFLSFVMSFFTNSVITNTISFSQGNLSAQRQGQGRAGRGVQAEGQEGGVRLPHVRRPREGVQGRAPQDRHPRGSRCTASSSPRSCQSRAPAAKSCAASASSTTTRARAATATSTATAKPFFQKKLHHVFFVELSVSRTASFAAACASSGPWSTSCQRKKYQGHFSHTFSLILSLTMFFWQALHVGTHVGRPSCAPEDAYCLPRLAVEYQGQRPQVRLPVGDIHPRGPICGEALPAGPVWTTGRCQVRK